ncbi:hypothetical protein CAUPRSCDRAFT_11868 [Caulochytrium protostelioides]|uniref:Uncharacterized protein n=1 Tax=Caulochytrium protostelioides TaxID=1555241 RepID=A0A4P9WY70_9FUNG|nr:hypothetical protein CAUPRSCDRAFT_11868 [Caulochytrium protostelioides]
MAVMTTCATTWTSASPFPTDRRTTSSWWEVVFAESPQEPPQPPVTGAITSGTSAVEASPIELPVRPSLERVDEAHTNADPMHPSMTPNTGYQPGLLHGPEPPSSSHLVGKRTQGDDHGGFQPKRRKPLDEGPGMGLQGSSHNAGSRAYSLVHDPAVGPSGTVAISSQSLGDHSSLSSDYHSILPNGGPANSVKQSKRPAAATQADRVLESWQSHIIMLEKLVADYETYATVLAHHQTLAASSFNNHADLLDNCLALVHKVQLRFTTLLGIQVMKSKNGAPQSGPNTEFLTAEHKVVQLQKWRNLLREAGLMATKANILTTMLKLHLKEKTQRIHAVNLIVNNLNSLKDELHKAYQIRDQIRSDQIRSGTPDQQLASMSTESKAVGATLPKDTDMRAVTAGVAAENFEGKIEALNTHLATLITDYETLKTELAKSPYEIATLDKKTFATDQGEAGNMAAEIEQLEAKHGLLSVEFRKTKELMAKTKNLYGSFVNSFQQRSNSLQNKCMTLVSSNGEVLPIAVVDAKLHEIALILGSMTPLVADTQPVTHRDHASKIRDLFVTGLLELTQKDLTALRNIAPVVPNHTVGHEHDKVDSDPKALRDAAAAWWEGKWNRQINELQASGGPKFYELDEPERVSIGTPLPKKTGQTNSVPRGHRRLQNKPWDLAQLKLPKHF